MRILLQNVRSKLFFRGGEAWTANPDTAFDFQRANAVYDFVHEHQLEDVQLVVNFASPLQYEVVPIERSTRPVVEREPRPQAVGCPPLPTTKK